MPKAGKPYRSPASPSNSWTKISSLLPKRFGIPTTVKSPIFETDETGTVTFPEALSSGTYYLREVAAREPYLLPNKDVKVVISDEHETGPVTVVRVADEQARGVASIHKTCSEKDDCPHLTEFQEPSKSLQTGKISSQSKYDAAYGLAGAEFDVVALDDVISRWNHSGNRRTDRRSRGDAGRRLGTVQRTALRDGQRALCLR